MEQDTEPKALDLGDDPFGGETLSIIAYNAGTIVGYEPAPHPRLAWLPRALLWLLTPARRLISWALNKKWEWAYRAPIWDDEDPPTMTVERGKGRTR
jgi:hypothetical protein